MKNYYIYFLSLLLLLIWSEESFAQLGLPKVIPPSPEASALSRYADIPVSFYTGTPQIEIPLYTLKCGDLTIPISLAYHASGIRVEDPSTSVGMGWVLNSGGLISRTIRGGADGVGSNVNNGLPIPNSPTMQDFNNLINLGAPNLYYQSIEADIFYYNFNGYTGSFYIKGDKVLLKKADDIKIEFIQSNLDLIGFTATVKDGTKYFFEYASGSYPAPAATEWYLTKIVSTGATHTINFEYYQGLYNFVVAPKNSKFYWFTTQITTPHPIFNTPAIMNYYSSTGPTVKKIYTSNNDSVRFTKKDLLFEEAIATPPYSSNYTYQGLDKMLVYNSQQKVVKQFKFESNNIKTIKPYTYAPPAYPLIGQDNSVNYRLYLDGLTELDGTGGEIKHRFSYYGRTVANRDSLPSRLSLGQDMGGYYNGIDTNKTLVPTFDGMLDPIIAGEPLVAGSVSLVDYQYPHDRVIIPGANRATDFTSMRMGTLKSIQYPANGKSEFYFSQNNYPATQEPYWSFKIDRIKYFDRDNTLLKTKKYTYADGTSAHNIPPFISYTHFSPDLGSIEQFPSTTSYAGPGTPLYMTYKTAVELNPSSTFDIGMFEGPMVGFGRVWETEEGNGTTEYNYQNDDGYVETLTHSFNGLNKDKLVPDVFQYGDFWPLGPYPNSSWKRGTLLSKTIFGTNLGQIQKQEYDYSFLVTDTLHAIKVKMIADSYYYLYYQYDYLSTNIRLNSIKETIDGVETITAYEYGNPLYAQKSKETIRQGNVFRKSLTYKYPYDFLSSPGYASMVSRFNISPVIEKITTWPSGQVESLRTNYTDYGNSMILPSSVETGINGNYEPRISFHAYDSKGNLKGASQFGGAKTFYLYSYNSQYPIAEIKNADYAAVESALGTSQIATFSNLVSPDKAAVDNFLLPLKTALPNAHITSFSYEPLVGMTSQTDAKGMTTFYEYDSFGRLENMKDQNGDIVKNYKYNYADGTSLPARAVTYYNSVLNQVFTKSCPSGGVAVTYTVEVGKYTSTQSQAAADALAQADASANGQAYANANGSCSTPQPGGSYSNEAFTITRTKNNCSTGQGSSVSYPVPAGTYTSTISQADARAQAEAMVAAAAQTNANNLGSCSTPEPSGSYPNDTFIVMRSKNNCPSGQNGIPIEFTVPANTYTSTISQADARMHAEAMLATQAQVYANANGSCAVTSGTFTLNFSAPSTSGFELKIRDMAGNLLSNPKFTGNYVLTNIPGGVGSITIDTWPAGSTQLTYSYNLNGSVQTTGPATFNNLSLTGTINLAVTQTKFFSFGKSVSLRKNNCAVGLEGSMVTYTVAAGTYTSAVSQAAANQLAQNDADANAQAYANANGSCAVPTTSLGYSFPYGSQFLVEVTIDGSTTSYTLQGTSTLAVPRGTGTFKITSLVPNKQYRFIVMGQTQIGHGAEFSPITLPNYPIGISVTEVFSNAALTVNRTKSDCPSGQVGTVVSYTVAAGAFTSPTSQAAANQLAQDDADANAQNYADANGSCTTPSYSISYVAPAGQQFTVSTMGFPPSSWTISGTGSISSIPSTGNSIHIVPVAPGQYTFTFGGQSMTGSSAYFGNVEYGSTPLQLTIVPFVTYTNTALTVSRTKNDCDPGDVGSTVSYTVAAGSYSSTVSQAAADQQAQNEVNLYAQEYANDMGVCSLPPTYYNAQVFLAKTRNDCLSGQTGTSVNYIVAYAKHSSAISQADADQKAQADLTANAQAYANTHGNCNAPTTYYNARVSLSKTRNNCQTGQTGTSVNYVVAYAKHSSTISQADANQKAQADLTANAQAYANANGSCNAPTTYYNAQVSLSKTRNNCPAGQTGSSVNYVVAYAKHSSTISQADANQKAQADLTANAQTYANANGSCNLPITYYNTQVFLSKTRNNCPLGQTGSSVNYVVAYAKHSSTISQADADQKAQADLTANAQAYANANASCATPVTFMLNYVLPGTKAFIVEVSDPVTGETNAYGISGTGSLGNLTGGLKNIFIYPEIADQATYYFTLLDGGITASGNNANITGQYFSGIVPLKIVE